MSYVLDTSVLSALMRGEAEPSRRLLNAAPGDVAVPQPAIAEVRYGLARLARSRRRDLLEERLAILLRGIPRASWDDEVSARFGDAKADLEKKGRRLDDLDLTIAAHALALGAVLATGNVRHFERVPGLAVEDWTRR